MKVTILIDNPNSWFVPYGHRLAEALRQRGHEVSEVSAAADIPSGEVAFLLSCERIVKADICSRNAHTIVVHASALPQGKGWSPTTWQVLEGKHEIPLTLFEAVDQVDAGSVYLTDRVELEGHELIDEIRNKEGEAIILLCLKYIEGYPLTGTPQAGEESFYARRTPKDSELDPHKTIAEQFELLRVVDNERYPAFFRYKGRTYVLKIEKKD